MWGVFGIAGKEQHHRQGMFPKTSLIIVKILLEIEFLLYRSEVLTKKNIILLYFS
uniref:Uncharacterized protein n=1 Tax=Physcomitrium patens TaxID=3218 RepID=A0A2K1ITU1_PHYPA|nr:hypothetical protein PHYPA_024620 [Physcomitrium patens]